MYPSLESIAAENTFTVINLICSSCKLDIVHINHSVDAATDRFEGVDNAHELVEQELQVGAQTCLLLIQDILDLSAPNHAPMKLSFGIVEI